MPWSTALARDSYRTDSEDRAAVVATPFGLLMFVADGMGGRSGGAAAAEFVAGKIASLAETLSEIPKPRHLIAFLEQCDREMSRISQIGETTVLAVAVSETHVVGAAVGDSAAWLIDESGSIVLNGHSSRKPWLGSGMATPQPFSMDVGDRTLLLATDGLWKYADRNRLCAITRGDDLDLGVRSLVDAARLPSGQLQDDVAVIVARLHTRPTILES